MHEREGLVAFEAFATGRMIVSGGDNGDDVCGVGENSWTNVVPPLGRRKTLIVIVVDVQKVLRTSRRAIKRV